MTRDFLVEFPDSAQALAAQKRLSDLRVGTGTEPLFGEIDNRGDSLFVTLTYPNEIKSDTVIDNRSARTRLAQHVVFVAIKNGMHASHGYVCARGDISDHLPADGAHVKTLHGTISRFFQLDSGVQAIGRPVPI